VNWWRSKVSTYKKGERKMVRNSKRKFLFLAVFLIILQISSVYALIPNAQAEVITSTEKGLNIINQVTGFNLTKYNANITLDAAGSYLDILPTENIRYALTGLGNTIEIQDTFVNGKLLMMTVLEDSRQSQIITLPKEIATKININMSYVLVQMAKSYLLNYRNYSANSFYGQLASTLTTADPAKNSTEIIGNIKFETKTIIENSTLDNSTTFTWSYIANGVEARCKSVSLSYKNGFLYRFFDSWDLYPVGSTIINLSKQQAENIAMEKAKAYSWTIGSGDQAHVINNFNVTKPMFAQLVFCPACEGPNARSSNPLTLYPMWSIGVGLDKYYPENIYGIYVTIWADTGQVRTIEEAYSTLPAPDGVAVASFEESSISTVDKQATSAITDDYSFPATWLLLATFTVFTVTSISILMNRKKLMLRKLSGGALCILIGSTALLCTVSAIPTINAASSLIWGNNSDGSNGTLFHSEPERGNQSTISGNIDSWFQSCSYTFRSNGQGSSTTPAIFIGLQQYAHGNYPPIATVWFDHGVGLTNVIPGYPDEFHFMLCGSTAQPNNPNGDVFDYQIYNLEPTSKNYFCFISTCMSARLSVVTPQGQPLGNNYQTYGLNNGPGCSGYIVGMPFAWTHGASMSTNGYANPDSNQYCYIGFPWGSAPLSQTSPPLNSYYPSVYYGQFVSNFFYAALILHYSVNQALDYASGICWSGQAFQNTVLHSGFSAFWPTWTGDTPNGDNTFGQCTMTVYGNGNMYLYTGSPDYITQPSISHNVPYPGVTNQQYQFSASATDPCGYSLTYEYNYGDGSGWTTATTHTYTSPNVYTVTARAHSSTGLTRESTTSVTIGNMLSVYASVGGWIELYPNVQIDGNTVGTAPISVPVTSGSHTVTVDDPTPDTLVPGYYDSFSCFIDNDYNYYHNGQSIPITSPKILTAYYNWGS
jgi:hypothetical protein